MTRIIPSKFMCKATYKQGFLNIFVHYFWLILGHDLSVKSSSRFIIGREKPGEQSEVAQLIQQTLEQERWQREMMEERYKQYMEEDEEVGTHDSLAPLQVKILRAFCECDSSRVCAIKCPLHANTWLWCFLF